MIDPAVQLAFALLTGCSFIRRALHTLILVVFVLLVWIFA